MRREGLWKANLLLQLTWKYSCLVWQSNATMCVSPVRWEAASVFTIHSASISPYLSLIRSLKQRCLSSRIDMKAMLSNCVWLPVQGKFLSSYTWNSLKEYSTRRKALLFPLPTPRQIEQVRRVWFSCQMADQRLSENWSTSLTAYVQGLPQRVSFCFTGFCLRTFSLMPVYSLKPVMDPTMPVKPMLTKGCEPFSCRLQTTRMGYLFMGLRTSQSRARSCTSPPLLVALPHAPRMEQPARVYSGIMLISSSLWRAIPAPSLMPAYQSRKRLGVQGRVMQWFHMRKLLYILIPRVLPSGCRFSGSLAMNLNSYSTSVQQYFHRLSQFWWISSLMSDPQATPAWQEVPQTRISEKYWSISVERQMYFSPKGWLPTLVKSASMVGKGLGLPSQVLERQQCMRRAQRTASREVLRAIGLIIDSQQQQWTQSGSISARKHQIDHSTSACDCQSMTLSLLAAYWQASFLEKSEDKSDASDGAYEPLSRSYRKRGASLISCLHNLHYLADRHLSWQP